MSVRSAAKANVVEFPGTTKIKKRVSKGRKSGLNHNKWGSVRNYEGTVGVDFIYLDERVREVTEYRWNEKNAKTVREQLDRIKVRIDEGTFRFAEAFAYSKKAEYFAKKEREHYQLQLTPEDVRFGEYAGKWYLRRSGSGRVTGRTLREYKSYLDRYLKPFFGKMSLGQLNAEVVEDFVAWAREQQLKGRPVSNKSINKYLVPMRMICGSAAIEYKWGSGFNPFFGFNRLPENDARDEIFPFTLHEQRMICEALPDHWRPYFQFAFRSGLRPGEQIGLKPEDIDWQKGLLYIQRAITLDEEGRRTEGMTKNKFSRRTIKLTQTMLEPLLAQKAIQEQLGSVYFFCTPGGNPVHLSNLRRKVWIPTLEEVVGIPLRAMKQTRHSFATNALSHGVNPLWIAKVMGHRDTEMVIKTYTRYVENSRGIEDGAFYDRLYQGGKDTAE